MRFEHMILSYVLYVQFETEKQKINTLLYTEYHVCSNHLHVIVVLALTINQKSTITLESNGIIWLEARSDAHTMRNNTTLSSRTSGLQNQQQSHMGTPMKSKATDKNCDKFVVENNNKNRGSLCKYNQQQASPLNFMVKQIFVTGLQRGSFPLTIPNQGSKQKHLYI